VTFKSQRRVVQDTVITRIISGQRLLGDASNPRFYFALQHNLWSLSREYCFP
jgi:hypothetical protein